MSVHKEWLEKIKTLSSKLTLPPPTLEELRLEYTQIVPGKSMKALVPFQDRFTNPQGIYQGGMLSACIDEVFGPLSYLTANGPCSTLSLNVTFVAAFKEEMKSCSIEAVVLKKTKNFIFMQAMVKSMEDELMAHAQTCVKIL